MHCPKCGQQQISDETRYCSRCGFLLLGIAEVVENNGFLPGSTSSVSTAISPRKRGVRQGVFIFLLSFLIVPVLAFLSVVTNSEPVLAVLATILLVAGGFLRAVYALMFESKEPGGSTTEENLLAATQNFLKTKSRPAELPAETSIPAATYVAPGTGNWRDSNDLAHSASVTDSTTKLLQKERENQ